MKEITCESCKVRPAMEDDLLCRECSDRYTTLLKSAVHKTKEFNAHLSEFTGIERKIESSGGVVAQLLDSPISAEPLAHQFGKLKVVKTRLPGYVIPGYIMLGTGSLALAFAVVFASTVLAFIGLGLAFWGVLVFFVRPQKYVQSDLISATAISSLKTIDKIITEGVGYRERGVYIPTDRLEKVVVFIPSEPFSRIPQSTEIEGKTILKDPEGLLVVPPGLALSNLIQTKLGFDLRNCGLEVLVRTLPKVFVEDLEIARDLEIEVKGDLVKFKLVDSVYADFCQQVLDVSRHCGLGCPMCSALACILAIATGKPVLSEEEKKPVEGISESNYRLLNESRL